MANQPMAEADHTLHYVMHVPQAVVAWLPLGERTPWLVQRFVRFSCACSKHYFPIRVVVEEEQSLKPDQAYILGK